MQQALAVGNGSTRHQWQMQRVNSTAETRAHVLRNIAMLWMRFHEKHVSYFGNLSINVIFFSSSGTKTKITVIAE